MHDIPADTNDRASLAAEAFLADRLAAIPRYDGESAVACADCGEPIPEERRLKVPGCTQCVECRSLAEAKQKHYAR